MTYFLDWILPFLVVLSVLIFVHELGHYLVARFCGVMVETFSIGFGPELFGWTDRSGTRWKVSAVPLGGYVKMYGEETFGEETDESADATGRDLHGTSKEEHAEEMPLAMQQVSFRHKTLRQRAAIVFAGPLANIVFALVVLVGLFVFAGAPAPLAVIGAVQEDSAAAAAHLEIGDTVLAIDGEPTKWFEDIRRIVLAHPEVPLTFVVERNGSEMELVATPKPVTQTVDGETRSVGLLGVRPDMGKIGYEALPLPTAVLAAFSQTWNLTTQIFDTLAGIIGGARPLDEVGGPLRIAQMSGQVAQDGMINLLFFMAALSVNLALINLLPIPVLDGGHLMLYGVEAISGKPLNKRVVEYAFRGGLFFVFALMLLATWNDLVSLQVVEFFRRLVS